MSNLNLDIHNTNVINMITKYEIIFAKFSKKYQNYIINEIMIIKTDRHRKIIQKYPYWKIY